MGCVEGHVTRLPHKLSAYILAEIFLPETQSAFVAVILNIKHVLSMLSDFST